MYSAAVGERARLQHRHKRTPWTALSLAMSSVIDKKAHAWRKLPRLSDFFRF